MKIAYVTAYDVRDIRNVNGAGHYIAQCFLNQSISLEHIDVRHARLAFLTRAILKAGERLHRRLHATVYDRGRSRLLTRVYSREVERRLLGSDADVIFSPICPGSLPISYLKSDRPIVIWTDATFAGLLDFYPSFANLAPSSIRDGLANERAALERCRLAIFTSEWAAQTAIDHHGMRREQIAIVPFGPYMPGLPGRDEVRRMIDARPADRCRLLFVGRDWRRKGGDVALAAVRALRARGVAAELTVVGCQLPEAEAPSEYVKVVGLLDKADPQQQRALAALYAESHMLIVPARADCAPAAVREAGAYGLPCVTSDVGGLASLVRDDRNGRTFSVTASPAAYAAYLAEVCGDGARYRTLARSSYEEYLARMSWESAGRAVVRLMSDLIDERRGLPVAPAANPA